MKKPPRPGRSYVDENKVRVKREAEEEIPNIVEYGEEADILAKAKIWNPKITPEELAEISRLYRDAKRERGRGR
jgi:hypothetical protein